MSEPPFSATFSSFVIIFHLNHTCIACMFPLNHSSCVSLFVSYRTFAPIPMSLFCLTYVPTPYVYLYALCIPLYSLIKCSLALILPVPSSLCPSLVCMSVRLSVCLCLYTQSSSLCNSKKILRAQALISPRARLF